MDTETGFFDCIARCSGHSRELHLPAPPVPGDKIVVLSSEFKVDSRHMHDECSLIFLELSPSCGRIPDAVLEAEGWRSEAPG